MYLPAKVRMFPITPFDVCAVATVQLTSRVERPGIDTVDLSKSWLRS